MTFKVNRLTDYATIIMSVMIKNSETLMSAKSISNLTKIPESTVVKLLKMLTKGNILKSYRGNFGGYKLSKNTDNITLFDIISAIEGPKDLICYTECKHLDNCKVKDGWTSLNRMFFGIVKNLKITDFLEGNIQIHSL